MTYDRIDQDKRSLLLADFKPLSRQTSEGQFYHLLQDLSTGVVLQGPQAEIWFSNPKALELLGLTQDQLQGQAACEPNWGVSFPEGEPLPADTFPLPYVIANSINNVVMKVDRPASQDSVWLLVNASPQRDPDGRIKQVICTLTDISHCYQVTSQRSYHTLAQSILEQISTTLNDQEILNSTVQALGHHLQVDQCWGILTDGLNSQPHCCLYEHSCLQPMPDRVDMYDRDQVIVDQLQQGHIIHYCPLASRSQTELICPLIVDQAVVGEIRLCSLGQHYFTDSSLALVQWVSSQCALRLTHSRLYHLVMTQVQQLEQHHQLQNDFISTLSHELRTPLSNIRMALRLMAVAPSDEKKQEYHTLALHECERQIELVNHLLDIQQLTHQFSLAITPVDLYPWLQKVIQTIEPACQGKQVELISDIPSGIGILNTDIMCLGRVLNELLHNAVKYTAPQGTIRIKTAWEHTDTIRVSVTNTGSIPATELPKVFEKFYRVPQSDRWKQGGNGLGLALVQQLITELQGQITVTSEAGWVTFTLWIPNHPLPID